MPGQSGNSSQVELNAWKPQKFLKSYKPLEVRYSKGFLRCSPEKWFPGFDVAWQSLAQSCGIDVSLVCAKPTVGESEHTQYRYVGSIDDEPLCISFSDATVPYLMEAIAPKARPQAKGIILEYLAMRILSTLAMSWSGPESSLIRFESDLDPNTIREVGGVTLEVSVNGMPVVVKILLGKLMLEKMDVLWRRQLHSTSTFRPEGSTVRVEIAHLIVPPSLLSDYLKPGVFYDLEIPVTDSVTLVIDDKPWLPAKLGILNNNFVAEVTSKYATPLKIPVGTTKLSFELGQVQLDMGDVSELAQAGALLETGIKVGDSIRIVVNGERVGSGVLCVYQGSLVVRVC